MTHPSAFPHHGGQQRIYRIPQAAANLGMSRSRVYELIKDGLIDSIKIGGTRCITAAALDRYVESLEQAGIVA